MPSSFFCLWDLALLLTPKFAAAMSESAKTPAKGALAARYFDQRFAHSALAFLKLRVDVVTT